MGGGRRKMLNLLLDRPNATVLLRGWLREVAVMWVEEGCIGEERSWEEGSGVESGATNIVARFASLRAVLKKRSR